DVIPALRSVQEAVDAGWYAAGFLSYEAAPAFDAAYRVKEGHAMPLLWFGIFEEPEYSALRPSGPFEVSDWKPDTGEQALEIAEALVRSGAIDILVIDSVAALVPKAEIEGEMGDSHVGLQARLMSQALRKLSGVISKSRAIAIFINQVREKVGVMFGNPETTPGGRALKFYSSIRLEVRRAETIKQGSEMVGNRTRIKVVKNKVAPPFKQADVDIMYGEGISNEASVLDIATSLDIVNKSGAWYSWSGERLGQGRENAKQFLKEHPEVCAQIEAAIREHYGLPAPKRAEDDSTEELSRE
ncbi:MAG: recombinase RecA, partial [Planifilum fulgidum]